MERARADNEHVMGIIEKFLPMLVSDASQAYQNNEPAKLHPILQCAWEAAPDAGWIHQIPGWQSFCDLCSDGFDMYGDDDEYVEPIHVITVNPGNHVLCDFCNEDFTNSDESGGLLFGSKAVCPKCAPGSEASAAKYNELSHIKARCPEGVTFADWVRTLR